MAELATVEQLDHIRPELYLVPNSVELPAVEPILDQERPHLYLVPNGAEPIPAAPELPEAIIVPEMDMDELATRRAAKFIGNVALKSNVEAPTFKHEKPIESLRDGIYWAAEGDEDGIKLVDINVETDIIERTIKKGHVMDPVLLEETEHGHFVQYNQTTEAIFENGLQVNAGNEILMARTKAETRNKFRVEALYQAGYFEDYNLVVFSLADNIPGVFFTETMSCSIQVLSKAEGGLQLESAFVAGKLDPDAEQHDLQTIGTVGDKLGVDYHGKTPAQVIDIPVLVRKDLMPDGAIDMVKLWDAAVSENTGETVFFGEAKDAPCSYQEYRERCRQRSVEFRPTVELIRGELVSERDQIKTKLQAIERLHDLSEEHMVEYAVANDTIDSSVFGPVAARHIERARRHNELGDYKMAQTETKAAIQTAESTSCPWAKNTEKSREELSWHGGKITKGVCANCHKYTEVGVESWCESCIKC